MLDFVVLSLSLEFGEGGDELEKDAKARSVVLMHLGPDPQGGKRTEDD